MKIVLDASMAMAWHLKRTDKDEAESAQHCLKQVEAHGALVPALWYPGVANTLLVAERRRVSSEQDTATFQADIAKLGIEMDSALPQATQARVLALGRSSGLTGYDAAYLELVLRTGRSLATFDRQLADAVRKADGRVFGDLA